MPAIRVHSYGPVRTLAANSPSKLSWRVSPAFPAAASATAWVGATRSPQVPSEPTRTIRVPVCPRYASCPSAPPCFFAKAPISRASLAALRSACLVSAMATMLRTGNRH